MQATQLYSSLEYIVRGICVPQFSLVEELFLNLNAARVYTYTLAGTKSFYHSKYSRFKGLLIPILGCCIKTI